MFSIDKKLIAFIALWSLLWWTVQYPTGRISKTSDEIFFHLLAIFAQIFATILAAIFHVVFMAFNLLSMLFWWVAAVVGKFLILAMPIDH